jgi:hypothetical protein
MQLASLDNLDDCTNIVGTRDPPTVFVDAVVSGRGPELTVCNIVGRKVADDLGSNADHRRHRAHSLVYDVKHLKALHQAAILCRRYLHRRAGDSVNNKRGSKWQQAQLAQRKPRKHALTTNFCTSGSAQARQSSFSVSSRMQPLMWACSSIFGSARQKAKVPSGSSEQGRAEGGPRTIEFTNA